MGNEECEMWCCHGKSERRWCFCFWVSKCVYFSWRVWLGRGDENCDTAFLQYIHVTDPSNMVEEILACIDMRWTTCAGFRWSVWAKKLKDNCGTGGSGTELEAYRGGFANCLWARFYDPWIGNCNEMMPNHSEWKSELVKTCLSTKSLKNWWAGKYKTRFLNLLFHMFCWGLICLALQKKFWSRACHDR